LLLLVGNLLVPLDAIGASRTAEFGNRLGVAALLMLISFVGGRITPSFTSNWLAKQERDTAPPATFDRLDRTVLAVTALGLVAWVVFSERQLAPWVELAAGLALLARLARWRGGATLREPLVWRLHLGYGWLALGFLLLALGYLVPRLPATTALHPLTVGAIATMTLAVMTRVALGHTGRPLAAGPATTIYVLVTLAALLRLAAPLGGAHTCSSSCLPGSPPSGAFGLFVLFYGSLLALPRGISARPI
jgi:uncharacterized protein involved in response to NO